MEGGLSGSFIQHPFLEHLLCARALFWAEDAIVNKGDNTFVLIELIFWWKSFSQTNKYILSGNNIFVRLKKKSKVCGKVTLENTLAVSYKAKYTLNIWSRNHTSKYLPIRFENTSTNNLNMNVSNSFIPNHQKLEANKMLFNRLMDKQTMIYPYNGILFCNKEWAIES